MLYLDIIEKRKIKVMKYTEIMRFRDLIEEYKYKEAAKMYYDLAWKYRDAFNRILNEKNVKNKVIDIMYSEVCDFMHVDQP